MTAPEVGAVGAVALPLSVRMVALKLLRGGRGRPEDRRSRVRGAGPRALRLLRGSRGGRGTFDQADRSLSCGRAPAWILFVFHVHVFYVVDFVTICIAFCLMFITCRHFILTALKCGFCASRFVVHMAGK